MLSIRKTITVTTRESYRLWTYIMLLPSICIGLQILKTMWRVVLYPMNKYRELQKALKVAKTESEEVQERNIRLEAEKETLDDQIAVFKENSKLKIAEIEMLRKRLDEMTAAMSHVMDRENKGGFESPSDLFNPTKIGKKLAQLYDDQALAIVDMFGDEEIKGVEFISDWIQESYNFCKRKAHMQILTFTSGFLQEGSHQNDGETNDNGIHNLTQVLTDSQKNELFLLRWRVAMSANLRDLIIKAFETVAANKIDESIKLRFQESEKSDVLKSFLCECADTCWLICTCHPPLKMRFDVKYKMHEGWIKRNFKKYTTKSAVVRQNDPKGYIICIAWPALVSYDDSLLHQKGEVIATD